MKNKTQIQRKILSYYEQNGRDLPWRKTKDPYKILVSEIMLQQTQVDRVKQKYEAFLKAAPTIRALADLTKTNLLQLWQGLGYNNRALRLQQTAQHCVKHHNAKLPKQLNQLLVLPGIGPYTARAVLIFAHNKDIVTVDTNIRRILIHELKIKENATEKELYFHAEKLLPKGQSRDWHNALMDYGATLLTAKKTGIKPTSKQGKFKDSDRYYRGQILKILLEKNKITNEELINLLSISQTRLSKITTSMIKDSLVQYNKNTLKIKE